MHVTRRQFVGTMAAGVALGVGAARAGAAPARGVQTVTGLASPETLGPTLIHEHVLVDFIGADKVSRDRYDRDAAFAKALPFLEQARADGLHTLVECTPAWLGRDVVLLRRLSEASGIAIVTNTGYYGAADDKFVPAHAWKETAEQIAARWIAEARDGIEGTGIRPGFMKIGVDAGPLSEIDAKLVRAAGLTHQATGLVIGSHTGDGVAAMAQLDLLEGMGVPAGAFIWIHAQNEKDRDLHVVAARRGAWVEFDGVSDDAFDLHKALVLHMDAQQLIHRTLISHDAGWYHVGDPDGGTFRDYSLIFRRFMPELRRSGLTIQAKRRLLVDNPREALLPREVGRQG
jgi:predicted metal-dependent phosphotriesterase family hydrolase